MTPTTLKESAARVVKISELPYSPENLPRTLIDYLSFANCCVNPNCKGKQFSLKYILFLLSTADNANDSANFYV
jgi:hypothetical protein